MKKETRAAVSGIVIVLGIVALVVYVVATNDYSSPRSKSPEAAPTERKSDRILRTGETGRLDNGTPHVLVARTEKDLDRFTHLANAKDKDGWALMIVQGKLFPVDKGTRCRVIDGGIMTSEIRISEGPHNLESGFVAVEFVKP